MEKLRLKDKLGYSSAAIGDAAAYTFIGTFLLFFLTTVGDIKPAIAGTITAVGSLWNTFLNPVCGYVSDNLKTKWGRRRPLMLFLSFPLGLSIFLLFTAVDINSGLKPLYYFMILLIFWTSFTGFFVPFLALGAEYTQNYHERTSLRSYAAVFNMLGTVLAMAFPTLLVEILTKSGLTKETSWSITGATVGFITLISILITVKVSKGKDVVLINKDQPREKIKINYHIKKIFIEYLEVLKLKPMKYLLFTSLFCLISYAIFTANTIYFFTYNHNMNPGQISITYLYRTGICILLIPIAAYISRKTDKRTALLILLSFGAILVTVSKFFNIEGFFQLYLFLILVAVCTSVYWQLMPAMIYDICEYDELETGKKRQGAIVSIQGLVEALASGIGLQVLGIILQLAGFNGEAEKQTELARNWIENCMTFVPAIFIGCGIIALYKYPITKEKFSEIQRKLRERNIEEKAK